MTEKNSEFINIVLIYDKNLELQAQVTIGSIISNTSSDIRFILYLDTYLYNRLKSNLLYDVFKSYLKKDQKLQFEYIQMNDDLASYFPLCAAKRITKTAAYRLYLQELYNKQIKFCIYLDVDLIVNMDINKLWEQWTSVEFLGAVVDEASTHYLENEAFIYQKNLEKRDTYQYVNSGVLLINIENWYKNNIIEEFKKSNERIKDFTILVDQDIINDTFRDKISIIDDKYNLTAFWYNKKPIYDFLNYESIVHYAGPNKPWLNDDIDAIGGGVQPSKDIIRKVCKGFKYKRTISYS